MGLSKFLPESPTKARLKLVSVLIFAAVFLAGTAPFASAQARGRAAGGGGRAVASGARAPAPAVVGRAVPRAGYPAGRPITGYPGRGYYPYYRGYYPYYPYYGSRFSLGIGLGFGYPYWGYYPYGYYGYYGYPYPYGYPYYGGAYYGVYGGGAYGGDYPAGSVGTSQPVAYGGVRIQGAPRDAQVYADGYYVGIVDDFNGVTQHLNLQAGVHKIEIRMAGQPPVEFDINVQPGQTITYHAGITR